MKKINTTAFLSSRIFRALTLGMACLMAIMSTPSYGENQPQEQRLFLPVTGDALNSVFSDTMMLGEYREFRDLSKSYEYSEHHFKNGTTNYKEGGQKPQKGLWKIIGGDKICYRYPDSENYKQVYCFLVYNMQGCYYKYSPYDMVIDRQNPGSFRPRNWDMWTSRAVRKGSGANCAEPTS